FGIQVARMAGMPESLLTKAESLLSRLESLDHGRGMTSIQEPKAVQLQIFETPDPRESALRELDACIRELDIDHLTPMQALLKISEIKEKWSLSAPGSPSA